MPHGAGVPVHRIAGIITRLNTKGGNPANYHAARSCHSYHTDKARPWMSKYHHIVTRLMRTTHNDAVWSTGLKLQQCHSESGRIIVILIQSPITDQAVFIARKTLGFATVQDGLRNHIIPDAHLGKITRKTGQNPSDRARRQCRGRDGLSSPDEPARQSAPTGRSNTKTDARHEKPEPHGSSR